MPAPDRKNIDLDLPFLLRPLDYRTEVMKQLRVRFSPLVVPSAFLGSQRTLILSILAHPKNEAFGVKVEIWSLRNILGVHSIFDAGGVKICKLGDCRGLQRGLYDS